jgi:hypothetical protein
MKKKPLGGKIGWLAAGASAVAMAAAMAMPTASAHAATTGLAPAKAAVAGQAAATRTLVYGDSGADVLAMQHRLSSLHYWLKITGKFDYDTQEAVYAFQAINGLTMDGVVGPLTQRALAHPHTYTPQDPSVATRIEVNISSKVQILAYYKNYQLVLISHISSAGNYYYTCSGGGTCFAQTPTGWFRTWGFTSGWVKVPLGEMYNPSWLSVNGDTEVYAIHGDTSVPNYPASHGCVRIPDDLATVFHTMITINRTSGTRVHIYNRASR